MVRKSKFPPLEIVVPLSLWQSAQKLRSIREERKRKLKKETDPLKPEDATLKKGRKGRRRRARHVSDSAEKIVQETPVGNEQGDTVKEETAEKAVNTNLPEGDVQEVIWDKKMQEEMPDVWGKTLESHYRNVVDAQIVQSLLRRFVPFQKKRIHKKKKTNKDSLNVEVKRKKKVIKKKIRRKPE